MDELRPEVVIERVHLFAEALHGPNASVKVQKITSGFTTYTTDWVLTILDQHGNETGTFWAERHKQIGEDAKLIIAYLHFYDSLREKMKDKVDELSLLIPKEG